MRFVPPDLSELLVRGLAAGLLLAQPAGLRAAQPLPEDAGFVSTRPTVRVEYWQTRLAEITAALKDTQHLAEVRLVFLGDSITDFWTMGENPWFPGSTMGRAIWNESFGGGPPENRGLNLGISGDRTEHVLQRLLPAAGGGLGELDVPGLNPEFVIILIGVNNTWDAEKPVVESVFEGIRAVVTAVHARQPHARLIVQSLLPLPDTAKNLAVIQPVNQHVREMIASAPFSGYAAYLELHSAYLDAAGRPVAGYFADGVHPNESGYRVWRDRLLPFLEQVRAAKAAQPPPRPAHLISAQKEKTANPPQHGPTP